MAKRKKDKKFKGSKRVNRNTRYYSSYFEAEKGKHAKRAEDSENETLITSPTKEANAKHSKEPLATIKFPPSQQNASTIGLSTDSVASELVDRTISKSKEKELEKPSAEDIKKRHEKLQKDFAVNDKQLNKKAEMENESEEDTKPSEEYSDDSELNAYIRKKNLNKKDDKKADKPTPRMVEKEKKTKKDKAKKKRHPVRNFFLILFGLIIAACLGAAAYAYNYWNEIKAELPDISDASVFNYAEPSVIYAADGETVLAKLQIENRIPIKDISLIGPYTKDATVAAEDIRFYEHNGVDYKGIARALYNNLTGGQIEGASTITQQLIRNTVLSEEMNEITIRRKVREAALAMEMEEMYSKDEILLMYVNTINYGDGCYGIEAAAQHYLGKSAKDLTLSETAALVAIPQSPEYRNPVYNKEACLERRDYILNSMLEQGYISQDEYDKAIAEDLNIIVTIDEETGNENPDVFDYHDNGIYEYPYFTTYVRSILLDNYSTSEIFAGGLKIYTTLDVPTQQAAEEACAQQYEQMGEEFEVAMAAIDPSTGNILALVGGRDFNENQFNIATQKGRPTGSSFKAFTLAAAIEDGIDPATTVDCTSPMESKDGGRIENFANTNYGRKTIQQAIAVSSNTGLVRLSREVGYEKVVDMARRLGIKNADLPKVDTLTLGVADITPLEMASAYATLASGGIYHEPQAIVKIVDRNGKTIFEENTEGTRVISEGVAGAVTDVLTTVFTSGTATGAQLADGRPVAGKTGTGENFLDHTLVGYTPQLACAFWIGDRSNEHADSSLSCNFVFKTFMDLALADKEILYFPDYETPSYDHKFSDAFESGAGKLSDEEIRAAEEAARQKEEEEAKKKAEEEAAKKAEEDAAKKAEEQTNANTSSGDTGGGNSNAAPPEPEPQEPVTPDPPASNSGDSANKNTG